VSLRFWWFRHLVTAVLAVVSAGLVVGITVRPASAAAVRQPDSTFSTLQLVSDTSARAKIEVVDPVAKPVPKLAPKLVPKPAKPVKPAKPAKITFKVRPNDTLTGIGDLTDTQWHRIWRANLKLVGNTPDLIRVGWILAVPNRTAKLPPLPVVKPVSGPAPQPAVSAAPAVPTTTISNRAQAVQTAIAYAQAAVNRGAMYQFGASGPNSYDCSGLTMMAYAQSGIHLAHYAPSQLAAGPQVSRSQLQPGDLLYFYPGIKHVGLYIGHNQMIEAYDAGYPMRVSTLTWQWSNYQGASRPADLLPDTSSTAPQPPKPASRPKPVAKLVSRPAQSVPAAPQGTLQQYAQSLLAGRGWSGQWSCFNNLVDSESGWNTRATNPSSGAYGIPQALPPDKLAVAGADWQTSGYTQLRWMMAYVAGTYGSPCSAWSFHLANGWY